MQMRKGLILGGCQSKKTEEAQAPECPCTVRPPGPALFTSEIQGVRKQTPIFLNPLDFWISLEKYLRLYLNAINYTIYFFHEIQYNNIYTVDP